MHDFRGPHDVLPPDLFARYQALRTRYFRRDRGDESLRPDFAGSRLADRILSEEGLESGEAVTKQLDRPIRRNRHLEKTAIEVEMDLTGSFRSLADRAETPYWISSSCCGVTLHRVAKSKARRLLVRRVVQAAALIAVISASPWLIDASVFASARLNDGLTLASAWLETPAGRLAAICTGAVLAVVYRLLARR